MQVECFPAERDRIIKEGKNKENIEYLKGLPNFRDEYQTWYSESKAVIRQLLPDRLNDFVRQYEKPTRKSISHDSYSIEDYVAGTGVTHPYTHEKIVGLDSAIPRIKQQVAIVTAMKARFESSLFDIRQLVQADLFDSELDAARELANKKFTRAAGAVAGVVLEHHLSEVCDNHVIKIAKKNPTISVYNDTLKEAGVIDIPQWRFIQHLGDIRNLCDHSKTQEPTSELINDLIDGVNKVTKTIF